MSYSVELTRQAKKDFDRLDSTIKKRVVSRLKALAVDPLDTRISKQLVGQGGVRTSRVGDWRILYEVRAESLIVYVLSIGHRGEVYKHL